MSRVEAALSFPPVLSLLQPPLPAAARSPPPRSLRTPSVLLKFMTTRLCVAGVCACAEHRAYARAYIRVHARQCARRETAGHASPCVRASTYARSNLHAPPLLQIICANNILCIICMPYAPMLNPKASAPLAGSLGRAARPTALYAPSPFPPALIASAGRRGYSRANFQGRAGKSVNASANTRSPDF